MADLRDRLEAALADHYRVQREVGRGGMARVFLAEEMHPRRQVAIKVLDPEIAGVLGPERFLGEVDLASKLTHPHILPIHAAGEADGLLYYVMPYVEGQTLRDRLNTEKQLPIDDALQIACEITDALAYAHRNDVIHRDIKPENILLEAGHAVVADFGIARAIHRAAGAQLTASGVALGTPQYVSPEQAIGAGDIDGRSDLYSLGCVLYEMLAGEPPFTGSTAESIIRQHISAEPPSITNIRPAVPTAVVAALRRALAKTPADRFNPVVLFGEALRALRADAVAGPESRFAGVRSRRGLVLAASAFGVAAVAVAVALALLSSSGVEAVSRAPIVVADFVGSAGGAYREVAREIVTYALDQSSIVAAVPRRDMRRLLALAGKPTGSEVDEALARELAIRGTIASIVTGRLDQVGRTHVLILRAETTEDSTTLGTEQAMAQTEDELPQVIFDAAHALLTKLAGRRERLTSERRVVQVATPSLEAYLHYIEAGAGWRSGRLERRQAMAEIERALELDPEFAAGWRALGVHYINLGINDSAEAALGEALRRPERLTPSGRLTALGLAAIAGEDLLAAHRAYDELRRVMGTWHNNLAIVLEWLGRDEEALEAYAREGGMFGPSQLALNNRVRVLMAHLGRHEEALALVEQLALERDRTLWLMTHAMLTADWGRTDSIAETAIEDALLPGWLTRSGLAARAATRAGRGAVRTADRDLAAAVTSAVDDGDRDGIRAYERGRLLLALLTGAAAPLAPPTPEREADPRAVALRAFQEAVLGDSAAGRALWVGLRQRAPPDVRRLGAWPHVLEASLALRAGRWDTIPRLLESPNLGPRRDGPAFVFAWWLLALAHTELGQLDSAIGYWERLAEPQAVATVVVANPFSIWESALPYSFAHGRLTALHARAGHVRDARRHYQVFTETFTSPDPGVAYLLDEAREALREAELRGG